ncbi:MAG: hypothetical protein ACKVVP_03735 [Chloroflexota bacterium]
MNAHIQTSRSTNVRPYQDADRDVVVGIHRAVFGEVASREFQRRWTWSQVSNPLANEAHRWTLESSQGVVGFLATIPQRYVIGRQLIVAHTPCDFMVDHASRFHGLKLMRAFAQQCTSCVTFDDVEATIAINRWLRIGSVTQFNRYVFPLTPLAVVRFATRTAVKGHRLPRAGSLVRWLRGQLPSPPATPYDFVRISQLDHRFDDLAERLGDAIPAMLYRDRQYLEWRYRGDSPHHTSVVTTALGANGALVGYTVSYLEPGGRRSGLIMDFAVLPDHARATHGLLHATAASLRSRGATNVQAYCAGFADEPLRRTLDSCGFHSFPTTLQVMTRFGDARMHRMAMDSAAWHLQLGDTEYSHHAVTRVKDPS